VGIQDSKDPYTWGFTLYSAHLLPHAKERFQRGIAKLDRWLRYRAMQRRFTDLDPNGDYTQLDARPIDDKILPSHDLARRFKFDVIDEYPAMETVVAGCKTEDGDEDFMAIGQHFTQWVEEHALNTLDQYVRNDHCLIVDEKSLRTLEALPDQTPPPGPVEDDGNGCFLRSQPKGAWVWMLDREYFQKYARAQASDGSVRLPPYDHPDERRFEPWLRIYLCDLERVWFFRPLGFSPSGWGSVVERDRQKFDQVNWWGDAQAGRSNEHTRMERRGVSVLDAMTASLLEWQRNHEESYEVL